jgi:hypothetical protein
MKAILIILCTTLTLQLSAQDKNWRIVKGRLTSNGEPLIGEPIQILGTTNGTVTNIEGEFCLLVPLSESIFISMPQCFSSVIRKIEPSTTKIKIKINRRNDSVSRKAMSDWEEQKEQFGLKLRSIFSTIDYQERLGEICR